MALTVIDVGGSGSAKMKLNTQTSDVIVFKVRREPHLDQLVINLDSR